MKSPKIQVAFYGMYGHICRMAQAVAAGARQVRIAQGLIQG